MRKFKTYLIPAFAALLISASCTKEKENVSPSKTDIGTDKRMAGCNLDYTWHNLAVPEPVGTELSNYLNCLNDDGSECLYTLPQRTSYGPIDIYPNVTDNTNNIWSSQNWLDAVSLSQQIAQTGLSTVAWPAGATAIKIERYEVVDFPVSYQPWAYKVNVKVYYKFCGASGPGGDDAPVSESENGN